MAPGRGPFPFLETFRARKAILSSSVSKNGDVYTPETSCIKGNSVQIKNMLIKQLGNHKVRDFAMPGFPDAKTIRGPSRIGPQVRRRTSHLHVRRAK